jgi:hypothetical protein
MAIEIKFTGFINEVKTLDFGYVVRCSHAHRYKNEDGDWSTASYTNIDLIIRKDKSSEYTDLLAAEEGSRITVTGFGKPGAYLKKDGDPAAKLTIDHPTEYVIEPKRDAVSAVQEILDPAFQEILTEDVPF